MINKLPGQLAGSKKETRGWLVGWLAFGWLDSGAPTFRDLAPLDWFPCPNVGQASTNRDLRLYLGGFVFLVS